MAEYGRETTYVHGTKTYMNVRKEEDEKMRKLKYLKKNGCFEYDYRSINVHEATV